MSSHIFFCNETDCSNTTTYYGATCYDCCEAKLTREYPNCCPDCGDTGATMLGMDYCYPCWTKRRHGCPPQHYCMKCDSFFALKEGDDERPQCYKCKEWDEACAEQADLPIELPHCEREHVCSGEWDYDLGYRVCDNSDDEDCPQHEPRCTCNRETGLMCDFCAEEYKDPCRGCGVNTHLWVDDRYCRDCYDERYGPPRVVRVSDEHRADLLANLPDTWSFTPAPPRHTSLESMRTEIAEIEARLRTNMTKAQKDDWIWLLQNRRADLAEAEKEMWDQYDQDDLRKLDLQCRR